MIFTLGILPNLNLTAFLTIIESRHIDCIVDIRPDFNISYYISFTQKNLLPLLQQRSIQYHSFYNEFAIIPHCAKNTKGEPIYRKVIQTANFLLGIQKLAELDTQGHNICILGREILPIKSFRFKILGKYLSVLNIQVIHILSNNKSYTQQELEEKNNKYKQAQKSSKTVAAEIGRIGEQLATEYLRSNGYRILEQNFNLHTGCEIDIIAYKDSTIHYVEVKTRTSDEAVPEAAIDRTKMKHIINAIKLYKNQNTLYDIPSQIDSIAIIYHSPEDYKLNHYENINSIN